MNPSNTMSITVFEETWNKTAEVTLAVNFRFRTEKNAVTPRFAAEAHISDDLQLLCQLAALASWRHTSMDVVFIHNLPNSNKSTGDCGENQLLKAGGVHFGHL
jgi:hypothetical protein